MTLRSVFIFIVLSGTTLLSTARQQPNTSSSRHATRTDTASANHDENQNVNNQNANDQSANDQGANNQDQALHDDLARMRSLVQQMETNLAFVDTTQSPLKHQFQLEIDMWKTLIKQMERRLQPRSRATQVK